MRHALVIGAPSVGPENSDTNIVAGLVTCDRVLKARCSDPEALVPLVAKLAEDGPLDVLDVFDHAKAGYQKLGDRVLFASDADASSKLVGEDIARALSAHLSEYAHLRLLGCKSAVGPEGRRLLFKLTRILGNQRTVIGVIGDVDRHDFDARGFQVHKQPSYFFDGRAAIDGEAPARSARIDNYRRLLP